jgi:3'-5' exoribonuclease
MRVWLCASGWKPSIVELLSDRSGQLSAKLWDGMDSFSAFAVDDVVKIRGRIGEYQGRLEITIDKVRKATQDEIDQRDFLPGDAL